MYGQCITGAMLLLPSAVAASPVAMQAAQVAPPVSEPSRAPAERAPTRLLLPLVRGGRIYGDVLADLYIDGRIRYERAILVDRLAPLLSVDGLARFEANLPDTTTVSPDDIAAAGVELAYDASLLEITIERIDGQLAILQSLGAEIVADDTPITMEPSRTSAYLNVIADMGFDNFGETQEPGILLNGAARYSDFVFEFDGGYDRRISEDSGFYRRFARIVYDEPEQSRRWTAGDVQVSSLNLIGGTFVGGVGVEKGRRVFNDFGPVTGLGGQRILLERDATVEVLVDGRQVELLQLAAGPYDLAQLRAQYSGRDAQLFVTDVTGRRQITSFDSFLDPGALAPGETEYSAALGFVPREFGVDPTYSGDPALTGSYRLGISNRLTVGGAIQASQDIQVIGAEIITSPQGLPGRFELGVAASLGQGTGYAGQFGYSLRFGSSDRFSQLSVNAEYRSEEFITVNDGIFLDRSDAFFLNANYSQRLGDRDSIVVGASWYERGGFRANRSIFADFVRSTRRYRLTLGVEYGDDFFDRSFGVRASISIPFGRNTRADATYNSRRDDARASISRGYEDRVGSYGYDLAVRNTQGTSSVEASGSYVANRFFARGFVSSSGHGIGNIGDARVARVQVGTALAFADGTFGIGRPINDSFVVTRPHPDLEGQRAVLGSSVQSERPEALSGIFGAALSGRLSSYNRQSIVYDLVGSDAGADIGDGVETVLPPYRSGYKLVVGSGASVSAYGFLNIGDERASLKGGTVSSADDIDFATQPFFTNSSGRFAIIGLRPGFTYEVTLFEPAASYAFSVPEDAASLLQLDEITIIPEGGEQE